MNRALERIQKLVLSQCAIWDGVFRRPTFYGVESATCNGDGSATVTLVRNAEVLVLRPSDIVEVDGRCSVDAFDSDEGAYVYVRINRSPWGLMSSLESDRDGKPHFEDFENFLRTLPGFWADGLSATRALKGYSEISLTLFRAKK